MASATQAVLAVVQRVVAAHHALQFRELADHAGGQVGLGQPRARRSASAGSAPTSGAISRPAAPAGARGRPGVPSLAWKVTSSSAATRLASRVLRSRSQKCRASANRARSTRSLPAIDVGAAVRRARYWRRSEPGAAAPSAIAEREIALIDPHGDLHDLRRQIHVGVVDPAEQRHRPFDQPGDLVEQRRVVTPVRSAVSAARAGDAVRDHALAVVGIDQHAALRAASPASRRRCDGERAGRVEAMALGQVGRRQAMPVIGAVAQVERHHRAVQQADDPAQRADPGEGAGAAPAHRFRPGKPAQQPGQRAPRSASRRRAGGALFQHPVIAFLAQLLASSRRACAGSRPAPAPARGAGPALDGAGWRRPRRRPRPPARCGAGRKRCATSVGRRAPPAPRSASRSRSSAARACIRAGISSLNSSRNSSGMSVLQCRLDVGLAKSMPLNSRAARAAFASTVDHAIAEVQLRGMTAVPVHRRPSARGGVLGVNGINSIRKR